jgi:hypothetical protein
VIQPQFNFDQTAKAETQPTTKRQNEAVKRDEALAKHELHRQDLITAARRIAIEICRAAGEVTSPQVVEQLNQDPTYREQMRKVDKRFMGAVFRSNLWRRARFEPLGSHCQPISVWKFNQD